jgi:uncharacterized protein (DUF302 family)
LLLPCNVVVQYDKEQTIVSIVDSRALLSIVGNPQLEPVAEDVNSRLQRVLDRVTEIEAPATL